MKKELRDFLEKRTEIIFQNKNIKNDFISRNEETQKTNSETQTGEIVLRIKTNSISPIQESWGGTWTEEISEGAFDESLQNRDVFSFIDHKIEMENIIGSTRSGNMKVEKTPEGYEAKIKLDLSEEKSKILYNKIKKGEIIENSFIFIPKETEYRENVDLKEGKVDYHVIHKKGELISIDPVVLAFYPQNNISFNNKIKQLEGELMPFTKEQKIKEQSSENIELKSEMQEDEKDKKIKELEAQLNELTKETQADKDEQPDEEKVNVEAPDHQENIQGEKIDGDEEPKDNKTNLEETEKKEEIEIVNEEEDDDKNENDDEEDIVEEIKRSREETQIMIKKGLETRKYMSMNLSQIKNKIIKRTAKSFLTNENFFNQNESDFISNKIAEYRNEFPTFDKEIEAVSGTALTRAIDGSASEKGLAYISYINDPEVKTELEKVLPEANGSEYIALDTLDIVKKDILVPSSTAAASPLAEGADATQDDHTTVSVEFKPTRYAKQILVNPSLANANQIIEKATLNDKNSIVTAIRNQFYTNLFANKTATFDSVKTNYSGGFTKEAIVQVATAGSLKLSDIDKLINDMRATYGQNVEEKFVMLMHPDTESFIVNEVRKLYNAEWLMNETQRTFRGIQIVTSPAFPDKVDPVSGAATNKVALVITRKDMIVTRGLNFVIEDLPYINSTKGMVTRLQTTRGEIKLIDPYFNTKALATGVISRNVEDEPSRKEIRVREKLEKEAKIEIGKREKRAATPEEIEAYVNEKLNQN